MNVVCNNYDSNENMLMVFNAVDVCRVGGKGRRGWGAGDASYVRRTDTLLVNITHLCSRQSDKPCTQKKDIGSHAGC